MELGFVAPKDGCDAMFTEAISVGWIVDEAKCSAHNWGAVHPGLSTVVGSVFTHTALLTPPVKHNECDLPVFLEVSVGLLTKNEDVGVRKGVNFSWLSHRGSLESCFCF